MQDPSKEHEQQSVEKSSSTQSVKPKETVASSATLSAMRKMGHFAGNSESVPEPKPEPEQIISVTPGSP